MSARDAAIANALTAEPQWIEAWSEFAAIARNGSICYGQSYDECWRRRMEADRVWYKHTRMNGQEAVEEAA